MTWVSAHIYYHDALDQLITDAVAPIIAEHRQRGLVDRAFFLRYWLGGPHVRLRLRALPEVPSGALAASLAERIAAYLREHPARVSLDAKSLRRAQDHMRGIEVDVDDAPIAPNNSFQMIAYRPELEKYGGLGGVDVAEQLFDVSSDVACALLADGAPTATRRLGLAFAAIATALHSFGVPRADVPAFLRTYGTIGRGFFPRSLDSMRDTWVASVSPAERSRLEATAHSLLDGDRPSGPLARWADAVKGARARLDELAKRGELRAPEGSVDPRLSIFSHYVHTFNNRLGVTPDHESRVAHLLEIASREPTFAVRRTETL